MKKILISLLSCLFLVSCNPDDNQSGVSDEEFAANFGTGVLRDFIGQVVDVENHPLQNVQVTIGSATAQTDVNGIFIINGADVNEKFAHITAKKTGYVDGSRSMVPTSGKNNVKFMMIPSIPTQTISSGTASTVDLPNGTKVAFDGAFQDENGNSYSGTVNVSMFHLLPSDENISSLMPGMLYAKGDDGKAKVLETFGMLNVELSGSGGQKLQIAAGHEAQITMKIDDTQMPNAPQSIPLWHFDEAVGYWKQESSAVKQGNYYIGEVSHFSWWNYSSWINSIVLNARITNAAGDGIPNITVELKRPSQFYVVTAITDSNGYVSGWVPAGEILTMKIYNYGLCGNFSLMNTTIGPFNTDTTLPDIVISQAANPFTVQGVLVKCDNSNVTNGYVIINYGANVASYFPVTDGEFSFNLILCDGMPTNFRLSGIDYDSSQYTGQVNYILTSPVTNVGNLPVCTAVTEFVTYQVDGGLQIIVSENITGGLPEPHHIRIYKSGSVEEDQYFHLDLYNTVPEEFPAGIYPVGDGHFGIPGATWNIFGADTGSNLSFVVSNIGAPGEYIDITFYGTYLTGSSSLHSINGLIHVIRDE